MDDLLDMLKSGPDPLMMVFVYLGDISDSVNTIARALT